MVPPFNHFVEYQDFAMDGSLRVFLFTSSL